MTDLAAQGLMVWFLDWRGQGGSVRAARDAGRPRARAFMRDAEDLIAFVQTLLPAQSRRVVVAHSMGAAIALAALARSPGLFDMAVLSAPMLGIKTDPVPRWLAPAAAAMATWCGFGERFAPGRGRWQSDPHIATRNPATHDPLRATVQQAWYLARPDLRVDGPTFAWAHRALAFTRHLANPNVLAKVRLPVLIGCPSADHCVDPDATRRAARLLPMCTLELFPTARHELFMETDAIRTRWLAAVGRFLHPLLSEQPVRSVS